LLSSMGCHSRVTTRSSRLALSNAGDAGAKISDSPSAESARWKQHASGYRRHHQSQSTIHTTRELRKKGDEKPTHPACLRRSSMMRSPPRHQLLMIGRSSSSRPHPHELALPFPFHSLMPASSKVSSIQTALLVHWHDLLKAHPRKVPMLLERQTWSARQDLTATRMEATRTLEKTSWKSKATTGCLRRFRTIQT
jgi:hypothetical protein